jgi:hypothetical protein
MYTKCILKAFSNNTPPRINKKPYFVYYDAVHRFRYAHVIKKCRTRPELLHRPVKLGPTYTHGTFLYIGRGDTRKCTSTVGTL